MYYAPETMKASSFKLPDVTRKEFALWLLRRRKRHKVTGASMFPLLKPGDEILYDKRAYRHESPEVGDIVVALHPSKRDFRIVKRVTRRREDGTFNLQGENPFETTDFKAVPASKILGKVTCVFYRAENNNSEDKNRKAI